MNNEQLTNFLIEAKLHTYAAQDNRASTPPLLPGAHQMEYRQAMSNIEMLYRDIYFGGDFFIGQETVYQVEPTGDRPVWSMVYAGGVLPALAGFGEAANAQKIYTFLGAAMRRITHERPFRGPSHWQESDWLYQDESLGNLERFQGSEWICFQGKRVYELQYSGGLIR